MCTYKTSILNYNNSKLENMIIVWRHESKKDIRNKNGEREKTVEVLFTYA